MFNLDISNSIRYFIPARLFNETPCVYIGEAINILIRPRSCSPMTATNKMRNELPIAHVPPRP